MIKKLKLGAWLIHWIPSRSVKMNYSSKLFKSYWIRCKSYLESQIRNNSKKDKFESGDYYTKYEDSLEFQMFGHELTESKEKKIMNDFATNFRIECQDRHEKSH